MTRLAGILWCLVVALTCLGFAPSEAHAEAEAEAVAMAQNLSSPELRKASPFHFVALGDLPYGPAMLSHPAYERLIAQINRLKPAFSVHIGDFKSGSSLCSDEAFVEQLGYFNRFEQALIYTPGDNEWTDCHRALAGRFDPRERLARLRSLFFAEPRSLGRTSLALERQSEVDTRHPTYVENARFSHHRVRFLTAHIVGSNNGFNPLDPSAVDEFRAREEAVVAWLTDGFAQATREQALAMVVMFHADVLDALGDRSDFPDQSGFARVIGRTLIPLVMQFERPVLVIHGDSHRFRVDQPFRNASGKTVPNMIRLEVFGAMDTRAVKVAVDPDSLAPFSFTIIENLAP